MKYALIAACLAATAACTTQETPSVTRDTGRTLFAQNCASCHGTGGQPGSTPRPGLAAQPADLTKIAARRNGVWPMLEVMSIVDGYTKRSNPRDGMPVIPALTEGPKIEFDTGNGVTRQVPARLVAVVSYLESIQAPPPTSYVP